MCTPLTYALFYLLFSISLFSLPNLPLFLSLFFSFSFSHTPARTCVLRAYPYRLVTPLVSSLANRPRLPRSLTLTFNSRAKVKA